MARGDTQVNIRLPAALLASIRERAEAARRSMNAEIVHRLSVFEPTSGEGESLEIHGTIEDTLPPPRTARISITRDGAPSMELSIEAQLSDEEFAWLVRDSVRDALDASDERADSEPEPESVRNGINLTEYPFESPYESALKRFWTDVDEDAQAVRARLASRESHLEEPAQKRPPDPEAERAPVSSGPETKPPAGGIADSARAKPRAPGEPL